MQLSKKILPSVSKCDIKHPRCSNIVPSSMALALFATSWEEILRFAWKGRARSFERRERISREAYTRARSSSLRSVPTPVSISRRRVWLCKPPIENRRRCRHRRRRDNGGGPVDTPSWNCRGMRRIDCGESRNDNIHGIQSVERFNPCTEVGPFLPTIESQILVPPLPVYII